MNNTFYNKLTGGPMISVLSVSGGMDSTSLLIHLLNRGDTVYTVSFDYGQKHKVELERLQQNLQYLKSKGFNVNHKIIDVRSAFEGIASALTTANEEVPKGFYAEDNMKKTVVPNRNAIFASITYGYALSISNQTEQPVDLAMGTHSGDHAIYPDCREGFFQTLFTAFEEGNWNGDKVQRYLPYINGDKETILVDCLQCCENLGLDFDTVLANTNTSYEPDEQGRANGYTGSDVERVLAFHAIGRIDPVEYVDGWQATLQYALKAEQDYNAKQVN